MKNRIVSPVIRAVQLQPKLFYSTLSTERTKGTVRKNQPVLILGKGIVEFDKNVKLGYSSSPFFLSGYIRIEARGKDLSIIFGEGTYINNNLSAIAEFRSINIVTDCLIGTNVEIYDSNFHGVTLESSLTSQEKYARPVYIGSNVFIGSNVKIMKGVSIGDGSVIANGSIVTKDIPSCVIAGSNPARVIKVIT